MRAENVDGLPWRRGGTIGRMKIHRTVGVPFARREFREAVSEQEQRG